MTEAGEERRDQEDRVGRSTLIGKYAGTQHAWFLEPTSCAQPPECGTSCLHCGVVELPTLKKRWHPVIRHPISRGSTVGCSTLLLNREGDDLVTLIHNVLHAIMDLAKLKTLDRISS